jgi:hypothetical protein
VLENGPSRVLGLKPKLGRSPARLHLLAICVIQDGRLGANAGRTKPAAGLLGPETLAFHPHPRRTPSESADRNPMRAAPPRALAPAPRNHLPLGTSAATQRWRPYQVPTPRLLPSLPPFPLVGHTPRVLMQGRRKSRRRTPTRIPLYSY